MRIGRRGFPAAFGLAVLLAAAPAAGEELLTPSERAWLDGRKEKLRLGPEANYPPFIYMNKAGKPEGLSVDYLRLLERKLGIRFELTKPAPLTDLLKRARSGEVDVLTSLKRTKEREEFLRFTKPYVRVPTVIIVRQSDDRDLTPEQLDGARVVVGKGYALHTYLATRRPAIRLDPVGNDLIGLRKLAFGEVDAAVMDLASASYFIQREGIGNLRMAGNIGYTYDLSFAIRKDQPQLHGILEKGLARVTEDERQEIRETWIQLSGRETALQRKLGMVLAFLAVAGVLVALVLGWNAFLQRLVGRRTAELERQTAEATALTEAIPDLVFQIDRDGGVLRVNAPTSGPLTDAFAGLTGRPLADAPLPAAFHERSASALAAPTLEEFEFELERDGETLAFNTRIVPCGDGQRLGIVRDVTAARRRRHLDEQALHAQKLESLGVLAGGIAHDFNNLLTTILGNTEFALRRLPDDLEGRSPLEDVLVASSRAADLCRLLLAYSGRGAFDVQRLDLSAFVREAAELLEASVSKTVTLELDLPSDLPPIEADRGQLQQVVMNLVINASEAVGEQPGAVTVRTRLADLSPEERADCSPPLEEGSYVVLSVEDTGCGMTPEQRERVFEPFYTTKFTGRGLGMAAALGIMRSHGGALRIASEPGKGSTIAVVFPTARAGDAPTPRSTPVSPPEAPPDAAVLVVDDDDTIRKIADMILSEEGFRVLQAASGAEAVALLEAHAEVSAVLLDQTMPDMNGVEAFDALRAVRPVPIVLCSGFSEEDVTRHLDGRDGFVGFLAKPFLMDELIVEMRRAAAR